MTLKNLSISKGATSVAPSGGTALAFVDDGVTIPNGVHLVAPSTANAAVRENITFRMKPASLVSSTGEFTKNVRSCSLTIPVLLASGKVVNNTLRVERQTHPETTAANEIDMNRIGAQLLVDADTENFWAFGSTS